MPIPHSTPPIPTTPETDIEFNTIRAQGAGGQNVNKMSSAVHLRFDIRASSSPESLKEGLLGLSDQGITRSGAVMASLKKLPINDMFAKDGVIREDGRMVHDMYLIQVKTPAESKYPWDYYKVVATVPGDAAFRPLADGNCPMIKK